MGEIMKKESGFTLVEILATITILGVIAVVAVPNILGVVKRNKDKTYIEDAKKLVSLVEYQFRSGTNKTVPQIVCIKDLETDEFETAPNGGSYDENNSCVKITISNNEYKYMVTIKEKYESRTRGIEAVDSDDLYKDDVFSKIKNF